ncbi:MAG: ATP-binding protein [Candidatus Marinimicrobia bacterium]|nr:ATP-binding protein [Candidatus Neomarinimicrobiota bacterium]
MEWIVLGQNKGKYQLISKTPRNFEDIGLLPKGSYLTVELNEKCKVILRVENSIQHEPYSPSPMIIEMEGEGLLADKKCLNIIDAVPVKYTDMREDGLVYPIPPQKIARRSNQQEINEAIGGILNRGAEVFLATIQFGQNQKLIDNNRNFIRVHLPDDMFFHQILITGKTGSGKTVAAKYLAQYFVESEEINGAVLAINVKDRDFLQMDKASNIITDKIEKEWSELEQIAHEVTNMSIYYPSNTDIHQVYGIDYNRCKAISLNVATLEPESLIAVLQNITQIGAMNLPDIFRYWQERIRKEYNTFTDFVRYFINAEEDSRLFRTLNIREEEIDVKLNPGTYASILRNLQACVEFFDDGETIDETNILERGKLSIINVTGDKGTQFGSILLRDLLKRIVRAKSHGESDVPILIIIDEVHQFYNTESSKVALGDLNTICRTGRSQKIGVIFSSQNPSDIPRGLGSIINTKFFFKTDTDAAKNLGFTKSEMESLETGYSVVNIHGIPQLRVVKFPLSYAGVYNND